MNIDQGPDLSHLTPEERRIIEGVISRQILDEDESRRAAQQKPKDDPKPTPHQQQPQQQQRPRTDQKKDSQPGNPLDQVANLVKTGISVLTETSCEVCKKTKFADTLGHQCHKCKKRICSKCGSKAMLPKNYFDKAITTSQIIQCWICQECVKKDDQLRNMIFTQTGQNANLALGNPSTPYHHPHHQQPVPQQPQPHQGMSIQEQEYYYQCEGLMDPYGQQYYPATNDMGYPHDPNYPMSHCNTSGQMNNSNNQQFQQGQQSMNEGKKNSNPLFSVVESIFGSTNEPVRSNQNQPVANQQTPNNSQFLPNPPNTKPKGILDGLTGLFGQQQKPNEQPVTKRNSLNRVLSYDHSYGENSNRYDYMQKGYIANDDSNFVYDPNYPYNQQPIPSWHIEDIDQPNDPFTSAKRLLTSRKKYSSRYNSLYDNKGIICNEEDRSRFLHSNRPLHDNRTGYQYSKIPSRYKEQLREHKLHHLFHSSSEGEDNFEAYNNSTLRSNFSKYDSMTRPYATVTDDEDPASQFFIAANRHHSNKMANKFYPPIHTNQTRRLMPNIEYITRLDQPQNSGFRKLTRNTDFQDCASIFSEPEYYPEDQVSWTLSKNNKYLLGHMVLFRPLESMPNENILSAVGLRLLVGEQHPVIANRIGTFVNKVKWGSPADMVGHVRPGDEIVEWNRSNLINLTPDQVNYILFTSMNDNRVEILVQRPATDSDYPMELGGKNSLPIQLHQYPEELFNYDPHNRRTNVKDDEIASEQPVIQLKLWLNPETEELIVNVIAAKNLLARFSNGDLICNSYCKVDLLPYVRGQSQRSRLIPNNRNPKWCQTFTFGPFHNQVVSDFDIEVTVWDVDRKLDKSALIGIVNIDLSYADLNNVPYWFPLRHESVLNYESNSSTPVDYQNNPENKQKELLYKEQQQAYNDNLKNSNSFERIFQLGPIGLRQRSNQRYYENKINPDSKYSRDQDYFQDEEFDLSELSDISDLSKLSIGSLHSDAQKYPNNSMMDERMLSGKRNMLETTQSEVDGISYDEQKTKNMSLGSESSFATVSGLSEMNELTKRNESAFKKSSKANKQGSSKSRDQNSSHDMRKRRPSIGQKFSTVLGISRKSSSTSNLDKKSRASFQRSSEVIPAHIKPSEKPVTGYTAPAYNIDHDKASVFQQPTRSKQSGLVVPQNSAGGVSENNLKNIEDSGIPSSIEGTNASGEAHVGEFVDGLGPGQLVGRQVLGMPCLGEIQLSFIDRKGKLEVDVIRARGLQQKCSGKVLPAPYVKLHLLEGKQSVEKLRTSNPLVRTLDPLYQQQLIFNTPYNGKILQVSVWGEFGKMEKKIFMGMCEIVLDDLEINHIVFGWYKLFGMIASNLQNFTSKNI